MRRQAIGTRLRPSGDRIESVQEVGASSARGGREMSIPPIVEAVLLQSSDITRSWKGSASGLKLYPVRRVRGMDRRMTSPSGLQSCEISPPSWPVTAARTRAAPKPPLSAGEQPRVLRALSRSGPRFDRDPRNRFQFALLPRKARRIWRSLSRIRAATAPCSRRPRPKSQCRSRRSKI